ncbi:DUF2071 domain-containing protein [Paraflavisolibacter sp. H34]|uniref:YqjF family protein n=1 Tax=Huijunlia imazamoxiresistens TaxID=3127457 RepID=UPI00301A6876
MSVFLTAAWQNLLMANYAIDPSVLQRYLPYQTELDEFNGVHYVSLVGFLFANTRIRGVQVPFHSTFEEVNLRFYVRYKEDGLWKRGVVFLKELVPKRMITFVANTIYGEKYATHRMKHHWGRAEERLQVEYHWKVGREWNFLKAQAEQQAHPLVAGSEEEFITEHYWGYTAIGPQHTGQYQVEHPKWRVHPVLSYDIHCNAAALYGKEFSEALQAAPLSVFLAEGSDIKVMKGSRFRF